jgi:S1-C subfamily serine protease
VGLLFAVMVVASATAGPNEFSHFAMESLTGEDAFFRRPSDSVGTLGSDVALGEVGEDTAGVSSPDERALLVEEAEKKVRQASDAEELKVAKAALLAAKKMSSHQDATKQEVTKGVHDSLDQSSLIEEAKHRVAHASTKEELEVANEALALAEKSAAEGKTANSDAKVHDHDAQGGTAKHAAKAKSSESHDDHSHKNKLLEKEKAMMEKWGSRMDGWETHKPGHKQAAATPAADAPKVNKAATKETKADTTAPAEDKKAESSDTSTASSGHDVPAKMAAEDEPASTESPADAPAADADASAADADAPAADADASAADADAPASDTADAPAADADAPASDTADATAEDAAPASDAALETRLDTLEAQLQAKGLVNWTELMSSEGGSVVQLMVTKALFSFAAPHRGPAPEQVSGTGFFISASEFSASTTVVDEAVIVTNAHVAKDAVKIEMLHRATNKEPVPVEVIGICSKMDVALLRVVDMPAFKATLAEKQAELTTLSIGDSDASLPGDSVAAMGFPLGFNGLKVSTGVVSGYQVFPDSLYLEMDASINPGNSGGPLLNAQGQVIGINSAGMDGANGMSFAIPGACLKVLLDPVYTHREWHLPFVGLKYNGATSATAHFLGYENAGSISEGVYVHTVEQASLTEGEVQVGDYLVAVDGKTMDRFGQILIPEMRHSVNLFGLLTRKAINSTLTFTVFRDGALLNVTTPYQKTELPHVFQIEEAILNPPQFEAFAGIIFSPATINLYAELMNQNLELSTLMAPEHSHTDRMIVAHVQEESIAERTKAVTPGMIVKAINNQSVSTTYSLCKALSEPVYRTSNGTQVPFFVFESTEGDLFVETMDKLVHNVTTVLDDVQGEPMCSRVINVTEAMAHTMVQDAVEANATDSDIGEEIGELSEESVEQLQQMVDSSLEPEESKKWEARLEQGRAWGRPRPPAHAKHGKGMPHFG